MHSSVSYTEFLKTTLAATASLAITCADSQNKTCISNTDLRITCNRTNLNTQTRQAFKDPFRSLWG